MHKNDGQTRRTVLRQSMEAQEMMQTYQEMNERICEMLRTCGHLTEDYAAARIEELEQQLSELRVLLDAERRAAMERIEELEQQLSVALGAVEDCNRLNAELIKDREKLERQLQETEAVRDAWIETARQERAWVRKLERQLEAEHQAQQAEEDAAMLEYAKAVLEGAQCVGGCCGGAE